MDGKIRYWISSVPLDEDWLTAEFYVDNDHFADLVDWGDRLILHPTADMHSMTFSTDEILEKIQEARKRVAKEGSRSQKE